MTGTRDPFKMFSFPVMQSTFCFADVKILAVPTTRLINNFRHLRTVNLIFALLVLVCIFCMQIFFLLLFSAFVIVIVN